MRRYDSANLLQWEIPNASVKMATVQQKARLWFPESKSIVTVQRCIEIVILQVRTPSILGMRNFRKQEMLIVGKVLGDHRWQMKLLNG
ncbi:hypothetical protein AVEN_32858-1 [Araneus ventricosus]|uniref:Uncharacterized protein n=1 Tax=Araneus ventricosus TaxID=182803 RepID=A0A4Y2DY96_ARAVE|nr:hypothetical protein AVEN_32858-1 [Araneus ventricosus]